MTQLGLADDVSALYSHAGISAYKYRSFNNPPLGNENGGLTDAALPPPDFGPSLQVLEPKRSLIPIEVTLEDEPRAAANRSTMEANAGTSRATAVSMPPSYVSPPAPLQTALHVGPAPAVSASGPSPRMEAPYIGVDRIFEHAHARSSSSHRPRPRVQPSVLPIFRVAGGAGVTTVIASLARALSIVGERVLLVDSTGNPILPFYFGSTAAMDGDVIPVSINRNSPFEGTLRILQANGDPTEANGFAAARIGRNLLQESRQVDRILIAPNESLSEQIGERLWLNGSCLVVLNPELRVILGLEQVRQMIARQAQTLGKAIRPYYILNRYNEGDHLHRLLKSRLAEQLGDELLPLHVPAAPEIDEALAGGMTVLDFAPHSPASTAFLELAEWYRAKLSSRSESISPDWE